MFRTESQSRIANVTNAANVTNSVSVASIANNVLNQNNPVTIGSACVAELELNVFVLLVEIEVQVPGEDIEEVLIIRLTPAQAAALIPQVGRCVILNEFPTPARGTDVDLLCAFAFGNNIFLVFDVETCNTDDLVLVRVPACPIAG